MRYTYFSEEAGSVDYLQWWSWLIRAKRSRCSSRPATEWPYMFRFRLCVEWGSLHAFQKENVFYEKYVLFVLVCLFLLYALIKICWAPWHKVPLQVNKRRLIMVSTGKNKYSEMVIEQLIKHVFGHSMRVGKP